MTMFHLSPNTGQSERCRAEKRCRYGKTWGSTTLKDGTILIGTEGEEVEFVGGNPTQRPNTKKPYGLRKRKKTDENTESTNTDSTTASETSSTESTENTYDQDELDRQTAAMEIGGWSHRGNLEGDSIEEYARKSAIPRLQREALHEEKKAKVIAERLKRKEEEKLQAERDRKAAEQAEIDRIIGKKKPKKEKLSKKERRQKAKEAAIRKQEREKAKWAALPKSEKLLHILGWKDAMKKKSSGKKNSNGKSSQKSTPTMIDNIDSWIEEQQRRGKTSEEAIDMLLSGKSF